MFVIQGNVSIIKMYQQYAKTYQTSHVNVSNLTQESCAKLARVTPYHVILV